MALIKRPDSDRNAFSAVPVDLADLARQAEIIRQTAADEAERIIAQARQRADAIESEAAESARRKGHRTGLEEGRAQGREEGRAEAMRERSEALAELEGAWRSALNSFLEQRERLLNDARTGLLRLALLVAERIAKRTIELDPSVVEDQIAAALSLAMRPSGLRAAVHPDDLPLAREALPRILERVGGSRDVEFVEDASLDRGSCVIRGAGGEAIDASIATQIDRIARALLPDEASAQERAA